MVELNHNVVSFNSDTLIKGNHGVLVAVFVTKKGSGSNKVEFRNGTTASATPVECTIFTAIEGNHHKVITKKLTEDSRMVYSLTVMVVLK